MNVFFFCKLPYCTNWKFSIEFVWKASIKENKVLCLLTWPGQVNMLDKILISSSYTELPGLTEAVLMSQSIMNSAKGLVVISHLCDINTQPVRGHEFSCQQHSDSSWLNISFSKCKLELFFTDIGKYLFHLKWNRQSSSNL